MPLRILHTNDFHGTLNGARHALLAELRGDSDLFFDTGDIIKAGNLAIPFKREEAWDHLAELDCTASVIGNRETHVLESAFKAKLAGVRHPLLCANLREKDGTRPLKSEIIVESQGLKIGIFGVSVAMVTEAMKTSVASRYLWDPPLKVAAECVERLRPQVDLLIGLTHIGYKKDLELAAKVKGIDILLTGHSHTVLETPERVDDTWICQGGSHGRYVGVYEWADGALTGGLRSF